MNEMIMIILLGLCLIFFIITPIILICWENKRRRKEYEYISNEV